MPDRDVSTKGTTAEKPTRYELIDPDVRLMLQVRDGSAVAFEQLVERYQARLVSILEHLVGDSDLAEDLAQEVFLRVYRARRSYQPTARFATWLFTIANNLANNALRQLSRRKEVNLVSHNSDNPVQLEELAKEASSLMPARQLDKAEMADIVKMAIASLGHRQRMVLLLSKFENMSYADIAKTMNLSTPAIKSLLSRARCNLRDILRPFIQSGQLPASSAGAMSNGNTDSQSWSSSTT